MSPWDTSPRRPTHDVVQMSTQQLSQSNPLADLGIVSTLVDAGIAFARGRSGSGVLLLVAAALSTRLPGLGIAVSVLLRVYRRFK